jgi:hypothetical protein
MSERLVITYAPKGRNGRFIYRLRQITRWLMLLGFIACPAVNYLTGGPAWSIIVMVSIAFARTYVSPDVIEFSTIGQSMRIGAFAIVLTTLIGVILSPGWLGFVLPIIGFSTLILTGIFFFINVERHRNNIMPLIWEILIAIVACIVVYVRDGRLNWPMVTMGSLALVMAISGIFAFHKDIRRELKKRLHTR